MKLLIKTIKNRRIKEQVVDKFINEFVFEYDRNDERLFIPIFKENIMYADDNDRAIIKKEKVKDISFIKELFIAANNYCDKDTSPQYLDTHSELEYGIYYIPTNRICMLILECSEFIKMLGMRRLRKPIYENVEEMITKIKNLLNFLEENKDKCNEFLIQFDEREYKTFLEEAERNLIELKNKR